MAEETRVTPGDRVDTICSICGQPFDEPLAARTHELEVHGGEGPGTEVAGDDDGPAPSVTGGSAPAP